jgi:transcriptional regulator of acetoin/glycerol metabolism
MLTGSASSEHADGMSTIADLDGAARAAGGRDLDAALRGVARLRRLAEQLEADQVAAARRAGWSWQEIAERLGVTKQTVHRKYRRA